MTPSPSCSSLSLWFDFNGFYELFDLLPRCLGRVRASLLPHQELWKGRGSPAKDLGLPPFWNLSLDQNSSLSRKYKLLLFFFFLVKKSLKINILGWKPIKSSDWQTIFLGTSFSPNKNISVKRNRCSQWKTLFNYNSVKKPADRFLFFPPSPLKCVQMAKAWKPQLLL